MIDPIVGDRRLREKPTTIREGDWEYAKHLYEGSDKSTRFIAESIARSQTMLIRRASTEGWTRGRKNYEAERTAQLIASARLEEQKSTAQRLVAIERVNAEMQATVLMEHRQDIRKLRSIAQKMFQELEDQMKDLPALSDLGEILRSEDERGRDRLNDRYRTIISLPERTSTLRALTETLKTIITLERQAFGISGVLEEPEDTGKSPTQQQTDQTMMSILGKFASVLDRTVPPAPIPDVVEVK